MTSAPPPNSAADRYFAEDQNVDDERQRLATLAEFYDPPTQAWLREAVHLKPGDRVLEAGCGAGTMLAWFAAAVGPQGDVLGIDRDLGHLVDQPPGVRTLAADLYAAPVQPERFDLVYSRLVLEHLAKPQDALTQMIAWLKPGGQAAVLDLDCVCVRARDTNHPDADAFDAAAAQLTQALADSQLADPAFGLRLADLARACGLENVTQTRLDREEVTGAPWAKFQAFNTRMIGAMVGAQDAGDRVADLLERPGLRYQDQALIAVTGVKPG